MKSQEFSELAHLVTSSGWKGFLRLLDDHKEFLQKEVNQKLREKKFDEAYAALAKMDDIPQILKLVSLKKSRLEKEK